LGLVVIAVGLVLFIRFDTQAAAQLTDNVLRPVLGPDVVIFLEGIYFNLADKAQGVIYMDKTVQAPNYLTSPGDFGLMVHNLDLTQIKVNNNFTPLKDEGVWKGKKLDSFDGTEVMAYTFIRPDSNRSYAITTIVQMDMSQMNIGAVAGTKQPGGPVGMYGPGVVPKEIIDSGKLVAAFDGGFQYRDGEYGMIVGNTTYLPLKNDLATAVGYTDGSIKIIHYNGQSLGNNVAFVRQNCPMLVENGQLAVLNVKNKKLWGRTPSAAIYTWRSGIGINKQGNLLFAVGNNLTPETLAAALKDAGAVDAMQLDINPVWVRFNIFTPTGPGKYSSTTLTKGLTSGAAAYLSGYSKDFFYLYKK
jgi:hypothetical protein